MGNRRHLLEAALAFAIAGVLPMLRAARAAGNVTRLVLVHGRSQQGKDPAALRSEWMDALRRGAQTLGHALPVGIKLSGFGSFQLRQKGARPGRNPKTGETAMVSARRVVVFHPSNQLKAAPGTGKRPSDGTGTAAATHRATGRALHDIEEFV